MKVFKSVLKGTAMAAVVTLAAPALPQTEAWLGATSAYAQAVRGIIVKGNQRVDRETILSYVALQPGRRYSAALVDESIKGLFQTGLFSDVKITRRGSSIVVNVVENPVINHISFEGNDRLADKSLQSVIQSRSRGVLARSTLESDVQRMLMVYRRAGRFSARVEPKVIKLPKNRVNLVFEINEGDKTAVSRITFIGNKAFSDGRLREEIKTRESGWLSFLRSTDTYDADRLEADQEAIRQFYNNNGYADFRIVSAVADLDRERNMFFITITVDEGAQYKFGNVEIESTLPDVDPEALRSTLRTSKGDTYSASQINKTLEDLTIAMASKGYAFAQVRPRGDRNYEDRTINVTYLIDEGPRVYVERINVIGNDRTRDYVVRREFDLAEGDAYNRVLVQKAERRLRNLGYFTNVSIKPARGSRPDRVVLNVVVQEKQTGSISFGVGYSTSDKVVGDINLSESNFLGRGQHLSLTLGGGKSSRKFDLSFTEPYFLGRRIAAGFDVNYSRKENNSTDQYDEKQIGAKLRFGLPITDDARIQLYYAYRQHEISNVPATASQIIRQAAGKATTSAIGYVFTYDTLDNRQNPHDGYRIVVSQEFAGLGGDQQYIKTTAEAAVFRELYPEWGLVGMLSAKGGHIQAWGNKSVRFIDAFRVGGETIRGFASAGIGPRDATTRDALGAKTYLAATAEVSFPVPYIPQELGLSAAAFVDVGTAFGFDRGGVTSAINDSRAVRVSAGGSVIWKSPFGPLRADFAVPLRKESFDKTQFFRIGGATRF